MSTQVQAQVEKLVKFGLFTLESLASIPAAAVEYRIQNAYIDEYDEALADERFEAWIDYAESQGWDPEEIDMALGLC